MLAAKDKVITLNHSFYVVVDQGSMMLFFQTKSIEVTVVRSHFDGPVHFTHESNIVGSKI